MDSTLQRVRGRGLFLVADAHIAGTPPGQRLEGYREQVMDKLRACLDQAAALDLVPVFLGDLFHYPRDNPNSLVVDLIELFRPHQPFMLVGNHDKYQARFTSDTSMAVLDAAGAIRLMAEPGPAFVLETGSGPVLVGASPDGSPLPSAFRKSGREMVVWLTHHNISFPDFEAKALKIKEIEGVDWVINGHIHRPQPTQTVGRTRWANPGNIVRLTFSQVSKARRPAASVWTPGCEDLERWEVPHLPFEAVFPDQEFPPSMEEEETVESMFLQGLERLAWRRTVEGWGLRQFLQANLNPELPESRLVWDLYEEVIRAAAESPSQTDD